MQTNYCYWMFEFLSVVLFSVETSMDVCVLLVSCGLLWLTAASVRPQYSVTGHGNNFEINQKITSTKKKYRPHYHISAPMGWLNNPAGFTYFQRQYHIFYQYHPYNGAWGHIQWGHAVSEDLVDWRHYPPAIIPREIYEKHGCLSGSAIVQNNYLTVFYTGSHIVGNDTKRNQNVAISSDGIIFQKYLYNPIIKDPTNSEMDFRNPKVWRNRNTWYMLCGMKNELRLGALALYTSRDMFNWHYNGTVAQSYGDMGYMWECPDFFELDGAHVLILSVRGIQTDGFRFRNLYQTGYMVGSFSYRTGRFNEDFEVSTATFNEIDYGHDFYAAQTMLTRDGRRLMIAWLGMWESAFVESKDGWASMLTIIRELRLNHQGRLLMQPLREMVDLRSEILEEAWYVPGEAFFAGSKAFEMLVNSTNGPNEVLIALEWTGGKYVIEFDSKRGSITVNRGGDDGLRHADWYPAGNTVNMRIFVDCSSIEVFCGAGEVVFSSRIYPRGGIRVRVGGDTQVHIVQYKLRHSVGYDTRIRKHLMKNRNSPSQPQPD